MAVPDISPSSSSSSTANQRSHLLYKPPPLPPQPPLFPPLWLFPSKSTLMKFSSSYLSTAKRRRAGRSVYDFVLVFVFFNLAGDFRTDAALLPNNEVQVLRQLATTMRIGPWNAATVNSCSGEGTNPSNITSADLTNITRRNDPEIYVACDCSFNGFTICHVTHIRLRRLNLSGELPEEFANLTYLRELDLGRNYFNGSIPTKWASLPLVKLSLLDNLVEGTIPREFGSMATLQELRLQDNKIGGPLPEVLGNLPNLRKLLLSGNNFTGVLPKTFGNLRNLTEFRIDGSTLSGRIPEFIGNWINLLRLDMQGTSMEGPIPSAISVLTQLGELRISDLNASAKIFPDLYNLTHLRHLVLRNCSITGQIPPYIGLRMRNISYLDLSFNRLNGTIPDSLNQLRTLRYMSLTNNSLTGEVSSWLRATPYNFDISYNNFTGLAIVSNCMATSLNCISSYPVEDDKTEWCWKKDLPCPNRPRNYNVFINCGGPRMKFEDEEYELDASPMGQSSFIAAEKWASSTTGSYVEKGIYDFTARRSNGSANIYSTARFAPLSLKYYIRCLRPGSYKVRLHFAEIMLTADRANNIKGKRIFDVYIQGKRVLSNFDIADSAGGIDIGINRTFDANVTYTSLIIHLYWAGKGTLSDTYGPLISAISVTPNFDPHTGLSAGIIATIVTSSVVAVLLILLVLWKKGYLGNDLEDKELKALALQTGYFHLRQIKAATDNFNLANKIGEGGFGSVYKGVLPDGQIIAVKKLSSKSKQGNREFVNEIGMLSALQHPHLVRLFGCCVEGKEQLLIYEYMENNSLANALFDQKENHLHLDWPTRHKICIGIAKGLAFLHEESILKIVHRDMKATNVLLDKDLTAKISDFGLAKLDDEDKTHISTRVAGTMGYIAPEYALRGYLTEKADVYSFGIVALEIVSGKSNTNYRPKDEFVFLLDWVYVLQEQGNLLDLVDPALESKYSKKEALKMVNIALYCTNPSPTLRPAMSAVVSMLEGDIPIQAPLVIHGSMNDHMGVQALQKLSKDGSHGSYNEPLIDSSISGKEHSTASSSLHSDLYDVNLSI